MFHLNIHVYQHKYLNTGKFCKREAKTTMNISYVFSNCHPTHYTKVGFLWRLFSGVFNKPRQYFFILRHLFDINGTKFFLGFKELSCENRFTLAPFFFIIADKLQTFFEINTVKLIHEFRGNNVRKLYFNQLHFYYQASVSFLFSSIDLKNAVKVIYRLGEINPRKIYILFSGVFSYQTPVSYYDMAACFGINAAKLIGGLQINLSAKIKFI